MPAKEDLSSRKGDHLLLRALRTIDFFAEWTRDDVRAAAEVARVLIGQQGDVLYGVAGHCGGVFVLLRGSICLVAVSPSGRYSILDSCGRPGEVILLGGIAQSDLQGAYVQVVGDGSIMFAIPWQDLSRVLSFRPRIALSLSAAEDRKRVERERLLMEERFYSIKERLAHALCKLTQDRPEEPVRVTREMLAAMIGATYDRATKALHELRSEGLVAFEDHRPKYIVLRDWQQLKAYGPVRLPRR